MAEITHATARADAFKVRDEPAFADPPTVMYVQQALNTLGFKAGPVDGISGRLTRGAIQRYYQSRELSGEAELTPEFLTRLLEEQGEQSASR